VIYSSRGWRIVKKSGTKKIDLAIALAMASYGALIAPEELESVIEGKGSGKRLSAEQDW
jgi:phage terminase large subunit-like protein